MDDLSSSKTEVCSCAIYFDIEKMHKHLLETLDQQIKEFSIYKKNYSQRFE